MTGLDFERTGPYLELVYEQAFRLYVTCVVSFVAEEVGSGFVLGRPILRTWNNSLDVVSNQLNRWWSKMNVTMSCFNSRVAEC